MAYFYGNTISSHWRSYGLYTTSSTNTQYTITLYGGFQSLSWGYSLSGVTCTIKIGSYSKSDTGSVSTGTGSTSNVRLVSDLSHTYNKTHSTQTITLSTSINRSSASYHAGTSSGTTTIIIPAKPSYAVTYNANGGSGAPGSQTKWYGETLTLSTTKPSRTGYTFKGWATSASGSVAYASGASYTGNAALTLYAVWQINTWTVSYNANGGSGAPGNQTKTYGKTLTLSSTKPTRSLYNFLRWNTAANGSGTSYNSGGSYTANAAATLYAQWELAFLTPAAPTAVVATNLDYTTPNLDVLDTKAWVVVTLPEVTNSMAHRQGYKIYVNDSLVATQSDTDQSAHETAGELVTFSSMAGKSFVVSASAYGEGGESSKTQACTLYGRLATPSIVTPTATSRGYKNNLYYMNVGATDATANAYDHTLELSMTDGNVTNTYAIGNELTINDFEGNDSWVNSDMTVRVRAVAFDEGHSSEWSSPVTFTKATYGISDLDASQLMGTGDTSGVGYAHITFTGASGEDSGTTYVITFDNNISSQTLPYDTGGYYYNQVWMSQSPLSITVTPYRNGHSGPSSRVSFSYVPQTLRPPVISLASRSGNQCVVRYTNAQYGEPMTSGGQTGYSYRVYMDGEVGVTVSFASIDETTHDVTVTVDDPWRVAVSMRSVDNAGTESASSNVLQLSRMVSGAGIYAYSSAIDLWRVMISNADVAMVTNGTVASVEHCSFSAVEFYNMETGTDSVLERGNTYTLEE